MEGLADYFLLVGEKELEAGVLPLTHLSELLLQSRFTQDFLHDLINLEVKLNAEWPVSKVSDHTLGADVLEKVGPAN